MQTLMIERMDPGNPEQLDPDDYYSRAEKEKKHENFDSM